MVRIHPDPPANSVGGVAQLGERLLCKQEVIGSIPFTSTSAWNPNVSVCLAQRRALSSGFRAKTLFRSLKIRKKQSASISDERDR
jgi:hypothetical protein